MPAVDVLARSIEYFKDKCIKRFRNENLKLSITKLNTCITWVLTVPAIWDDSAKQCLEEAAERVLYL